MGYALAVAARDCGAQVRLINAPTSLRPLYGVEMIPVRTAREMYGQVMDCLDDTDILIMAAAVADYRPTRIAPQKLKKGEERFVLELERTQDILAAVADERSAGKPRLVVGFGAETENLLANARVKLRDKRLDLLVANDVSAADSGFGVETNRVTLLTPDGSTEAFPLMSKSGVAERVLERVASLWRSIHE